MKLKPLALLALVPAVLTSCGAGPFANPFVAPISVTLSPASLNLQQGASDRVSVTGTSAGAPVTGLTIAAQDVPPGLKVVTATGTVIVTATSTAIPGPYSVPLAVTAPGGEGQAVLAVTVTPAQVDYTVAFSPAAPTLNAGTSVHVSLTGTGSGQGQPRPVSVTAVSGGLPVTLDVNDPQGLTIAPPDTQVPGTYVLQVTTASGHSTRTDPLLVTVTAPTTKP